jgi:hypothetical protein
MMTFSKKFDRHDATDGLGRFDLGLQTATNWFLTVTAPGLTPVIRYVDLRGAPPPTVEGHSPAALIISLSLCSAIVRGTVRDAGGGPIVGAEVSLAASWKNGGVTATTDASGRYEHCVPTTGAPVLTYILVVAAAGYGTVETVAPKKTRVFDFQLEPHATIAGRATDADTGLPLANVKITLGPIGDAHPNSPPVDRVQRVRLETFSDAEGRYEIRGLAAGRYQLEAQADDHTLAKPRPLLTLGAGAHGEGEDIALARAAIVEGTVIRAGQPAGNESIWFRGREKQENEDEWFDLGWGVSRSDGRIRVRLPLGSTVERIFADPQHRARRPWPRALSPERIHVNRLDMMDIRIELPAASVSSDGGI